MAAAQKILSGEKKWTLSVWNQYQAFIKEHKIIPLGDSTAHSDDRSPEKEKTVEEVAGRYVKKNQQPALMQSLAQLRLSRLQQQKPDSPVAAAVEEEISPDTESKKRSIDEVRKADVEIVDQLIIDAQEPAVKSAAQKKKKKLNFV